MVKNSSSANCTDVFYYFDTLTTGPLVKWDWWDNSNNIPQYTLTWGNISLCSDKEHPLSEQYEDENGNLVMRVALAGYPKENISVTFVDNILVIAASKVEDEHKSLSIAKRACKKEFVDSKGVWNYNNLKAVYKDGLLTVSIPKKTEKMPVKVTIE